MLDVNATKRIQVNIHLLYSYSKKNYIINIWWWIWIVIEWYRACGLFSLVIRHIWVLWHCCYRKWLGLSKGEPDMKRIKKYHKLFFRLITPQTFSHWLLLGLFWALLFLAPWQTFLAARPAFMWGQLLWSYSHCAWYLQATTFIYLHFSRYSH